MLKITPPIPKNKSLYLTLKDVFHGEKGVIDLASIMVGTIVTGLIGGVVASTVFVVIPWTQDNAAKQQLDSIVSAENAYFGLSADPSSSVGAKTNTFANSSELAAANLLASGDDYCVSTPYHGKGYEAYVKSDSGNWWLATDTNPVPVSYNGSLPSDCSSLLPPYVDPAPKTTIMTYQCDTDTTGALPMYSNLNGTETWSDGVTQTYSAANDTVTRSFTAGVKYTMTFEGTYRAMNGSRTIAAPLTSCLLSVDHWGSNTGLTDVSSAFNKAKKLTAVPDHIPATVELMPFMFTGASSFNDPNISKWDVSNVRSMGVMFDGATSFNQPLNHWNVSKVTDMSLMFRSASSFNQPLNNWNTSKATTMFHMFIGASKFNQPLNHWDVGNVTNMNSMFYNASSFNQPIGNWNVGKVTTMQGMFAGAKSFNQSLNGWNVSNVTTMMDMFNGATVFNQPLNNWNVSKVTIMQAMFANTPTFNQSLDSWNVSNLKTMHLMFYNAKSFNQPLGSWNTSNVVDMNRTFEQATVFNQNISMWSLASNPTSNNFRLGSALTAANSPFGV